jgi:guanylate kinase
MDKSNRTRGKLVIVSGPSGVGKSTICKEVANRIENVYLSVSVTTRPRGKGEKHGKNYWFISKEEFQQRVGKGEFLEHAEVFGHLYGTPKDKVEQALNQGKTVILEIDVQGARQVKVTYPDAVMVFILPPSAKVLAERLNRRGRDNSQAAEDRLGGASDEIAAAWQYYQHMVINENLEQAIKEVMQIIRKGSVEEK